MINNLLKTSLESKTLISRKIDNCLGSIDALDVDEHWNNHSFGGVDFNHSLLAVDGSFNQVSLVVGNVCTLSSLALYSGNSTMSSVCDINHIVFLPSTTVDYNSILSKQMGVLELKSILNSLYSMSDVDYLLLDGDIHSILNHIARGVNTVMRNEQSIVDLTNEIVGENIDSYSADVPSIDDIISDTSHINNFSKSELVMYYLMIEELSILYNILKDYSDKIICISKTSRTHYLYDRGVSDLALIDNYCKFSGFSDEQRVVDNRFRFHRFNEIFYGRYPVYDSFFRELTFTNRFVKLSDRASVLKVQLVGDVSRSDFIRVLDVLSDASLTSTGYPVLLKKVHDDVKITGRDMDNIMRNLRLDYYKNERDML